MVTTLVQIRKGDWLSKTHHAYLQHTAHSPAATGPSASVTLASGHRDVALSDVGLPVFLPATGEEGQQGRCPGAGLSESPAVCCQREAVHTERKPCQSHTPAISTGLLHAHGLDRRPKAAKTIPPAVRRRTETQASAGKSELSRQLG